MPTTDLVYRFSNLRLSYRKNIAAFLGLPLGDDALSDKENIAEQLKTAKSLGLLDAVAEMVACVEEEEADGTDTASPMPDLIIRIRNADEAWVGNYNGIYWREGGNYFFRSSVDDYVEGQPLTLCTGYESVPFSPYDWGGGFRRRNRHCNSTVELRLEGGCDG